MTAMARLTALLFAMWVGVTVSTVVDLEKRVIGGQVCGPKERLYHVKLIFTDLNKKRFLCGGSLISLIKDATQSQWILTAAHCLKPGGTFTAHIGVHHGNHPKDVPISAGQSFIFNDSKQHDLMLLKLPKAVGIKPIELPDCQPPLNIDAVVQIAGQASTQVDPNNEKKPGYSSNLICADTSIVDCQTYIGYLRQVDPRFYAIHRHEHWICTFSPPVDACCGDSGGGVVYNKKIYGVISHGNAKLAAVSPVASTNLCYGPYNQWIRNTIAQP